MKILLLLPIFVLVLSNRSETIIEEKSINDNSLINDINESIIDGFFDGDSTIISKNDTVYFLK